MKAFPQGRIGDRKRNDKSNARRFCVPLLLIWIEQG
jgi:hypothetical protein